MSQTKIPGNSFRGGDASTVKLVCYWKRLTRSRRSRRCISRLVRVASVAAINLHGTTTKFASGAGLGLDCTNSTDCERNLESRREGTVLLEY
jgi:hypothetical protein